MATESGRHTEGFKVPPEGLRREGVPKGAPARPAAASRRLLTKKAKLYLAVTLAVVLALIVGVVSVRATNSDRTPEAAVREYVQLISDGKYDEASKLVDPSSRFKTKLRTVALLRVPSEITLVRLRCEVMMLPRCK